MTSLLRRLSFLVLLLVESRLVVRPTSSFSPVARSRTRHRPPRDRRRCRQFGRIAERDRVSSSRRHHSSSSSSLSSCGPSPPPSSSGDARRGGASRPTPLGSSRSDSDGVGDDGGRQQTKHDNGRDRRSFLGRCAMTLTSMGAGGANANARGLIRFPCRAPLSNTYHLLRSGSSLLEVEDVWSTNPLFLTNREAALSDIGREQVREACEYLKSTARSIPTVVRYSLAAASLDSADIVGEELRIGRDRLVPEFNYMDPRAIGGWDFAALNSTEEAVWALDADEAGPYGGGGKPPSNEDGTPAETLADQVVRLTNLMSVLETLYSGDTVLLVFPDGTGPALLSCLIGGIPLDRVHELQFRPGEIRCDVTFDTVNAIASRQPSSTYFDALERGRIELKQLRENPDVLRNVKDLKYEEERELERIELQGKKEEEARRKELEILRKGEDTMEMKGDVYQNLLYPLLAGVAVVVSSVFGAVDNADKVERGNTTEIDIDDQFSQSSAASAIVTEAPVSMYDPTEHLKSVPDGMINDDNNSSGMMNDDDDAAARSDINQYDADYDDAWLGSIYEIIQSDNLESQ